MLCNEFHRPDLSARQQAIVIAASTGGLQPLCAIAAQIGRSGLKAPVFVILHMPAGLEQTIALQLEATSGLPTFISKEGLTASSNALYVAVPGKHTILEADRLSVRMRLDDSDTRSGCKPSADILFRSAAEIYRHNLVGIVLSGMGTDDLEGCRAIVSAGGKVLAQDEQTSAVWGMPGAVARAGLVDVVGDASTLGEFVSRRFTPHARSLA